MITSPRIVYVEHGSFEVGPVLSDMDFDASAYPAEPRTMVNRTLSSSRP